MDRKLNFSYSNDPIVNNFEGLANALGTGGALAGALSSSLDLFKQDKNTKAEKKLQEQIDKEALNRVAENNKGAMARLIETEKARSLREQNEQSLIAEEQKKKEEQDRLRAGLLNLTDTNDDLATRYKNIIDNPDSTEDEINVATQELLKLSPNIANENTRILMDEFNELNKPVQVVRPDGNVVTIPRSQIKEGDKLFSDVEKERELNESNKGNIDNEANSGNPSNIFQNTLGDPTVQEALNDAFGKGPGADKGEALSRFNNLFESMGITNKNEQANIIKNSLGSSGIFRDGKVDPEHFKQLYKHENILTVSGGKASSANKGEVMAQIWNNPDRYKIYTLNNKKYAIDLQDPQSIDFLSEIDPDIATKIKEERFKYLNKEAADANDSVFDEVGAENKVTSPPNTDQMIQNFLDNQKKSPIIIRPSSGSSLLQDYNQSRLIQGY